MNNPALATLFPYSEESNRCTGPSLTLPVYIEISKVACIVGVPFTDPHANLML